MTPISRSLYARVYVEVLLGAVIGVMAHRDGRISAIRTRNRFEPAGGGGTRKAHAYGHNARNVERTRFSAIRTRNRCAPFAHAGAGFNKGGHA